MTSKWKKGAQNVNFPLTIAIVGLAPLSKVEADYLPPPKNQFIIRVNGDDYFMLLKEDLGFDPS